MSTMDVLEPDRVATQGKITAVISRPVGNTAPNILSMLFRVTGVTRTNEWPLLARAGICFVPAGAPLLSHRSASSNVRCLCLFSGRPTPSETQVTHGLRLSDLPDDKLHTKAARLTRFERFTVWLAVHRLRQSHTLVVDDPTRELTQVLTNRVMRLLAEAAEIPSAVVVITPDATFATNVADRVLAQDLT